MQYATDYRNVYCISLSYFHFAYRSHLLPATYVNHNCDFNFSFILNCISNVTPPPLLNSEIKCNWYSSIISCQNLIEVSLAYLTILTGWLKIQGGLINKFDVEYDSNCIDFWKKNVCTYLLTNRCNKNFANSNTVYVQVHFWNWRFVTLQTKNRTCKTHV